MTLLHRVKFNHPARFYPSPTQRILLLSTLEQLGTAEMSTGLERGRKTSGGVRSEDQGSKVMMDGQQ
jgi:hypothetical protein